MSKVNYSGDAKMFVTNRATLLGALMVVFQTEGAMAENKALVRMRDDAEYRGGVTVAVDGKDVLSVQYRGSGDEVDAGRIEFPEGAAKVRLSGDITRTRGRRSLTSRGSATLPIADLTPLVRTLRTDEAWPKRLTNFLQQKVAFDETILEWAPDVQFDMSPGERADKATLASAAQKLGYALPAEHVQVLEQFGAWRLNDSFTTPAEKLQNALDQIVSLWEFPRTTIQSLPEESKTLLRSSVILFTLVGDGYRAILYQPPSAGAKESEGVFYFSEDDSLVEIHAFRTPEGKAMNYSQVMISLIAAEGLSRYGSTGEVVLIDRTSELPPVYSLQVDPDGTSLRFGLYWEPRLGR